MKKKRIIKTDNHLFYEIHLTKKNCTLLRIQKRKTSGIIFFIMKFFLFFYLINEIKILNIHFNLDEVSLVIFLLCYKLNLLII